MEENSSNKFYLGICMAGAVSAGAYTAGVIDYLIEALEIWEQKRGQEGVPTHKVEIPVLGGASAGGMTSIISAAALQQKTIHINEPESDLLAEQPQNILYHSWVDLTHEDMFSEMLNVEDIKTNGVLSMFNSDFIDIVANRVIKPKTSTGQFINEIPPYFSKNLKVFTTLTNLQGYSYDVNFKDSSSIKNHPYFMEIHNDYACFELNNNGSSTSLEPGWIPLNIPKQINTDVAVDAAMATGAFPVGLKARFVTRKQEDVNLDNLIKPDLIKGIILAEDNPYVSLNVDGGMINNEPFDKVREVLLKVTGQNDPKVYQNYNLFNSTVLMIAPFPSSKPNTISKSQQLLNIIGLTLSAMLGQMRAKPAILVDAMDPNCAGQYLIAPSRKVSNKNSEEIAIQGERAIACGALGGFGGFINKEFRVHDYFLGRYNCKIFLRDYFTIPISALESNEIFKSGYSNAKVKNFVSTVDGSVQIIPIFEELTDYKFPNLKFKSGKNWPQIESSDVDKYLAAIKNRVQEVLLNIFNLGTLSKVLIWIGAKAILNRLIANSIVNSIKKGFADWNLLK